MAADIDRWLRQEHLAEDFLAVLGLYTTFTEEELRRIRALGPVNAYEYEHEVERWFSADDLAALYEANPQWAAVEASVYGSLLTG